MRDYSISLYMRHFSEKDRIYQWVISFILLSLYKTNTAQKESVFGVILVHIFPAFSRIRTEYGEIPYSIRMRENAGKMRTRITPNTDSFYAVKRQRQFKNTIYGKAI